MDQFKSRASKHKDNPHCKVIYMEKSKKNMGTPIMLDSVHYQSMGRSYIFFFENLEEATSDTKLQHLSLVNFWSKYDIWGVENIFELNLHAP